MIHTADRGGSSRTGTITWLDVKFLLAMLWRTSPFKVAALTAVVVLAACLPAVSVKITVQLLDALSDPPRAALWLLVQFGLITVTGLMGFVQGYLVQRLDQETRFAFQAQIAHKVSLLPLESLEDPVYFDRLTRAQQGSASGSSALITELANIVSVVIAAGAYVAILAQVDWLLAAMPLTISLPVVVLHYIGGKQFFEHRSRQTQPQRELQYYYGLQTGRQEMKELRMYGLVDHIRRMWEEKYWQLADQDWHLVRLDSRRQFALTSTGHLLTLITSGYMLWLTTRGMLSLSQFVALGQTVTSLFARLRTVGPSFRNLFIQFLSISETRKFLDLPNVNCPPHAPQLEPLARTTEGITVEGLTFCYPTNAQPTLKGVSFHIRAGERVALVGTNGAGKSTLVKCLLGLYQPTAGTIHYDGVNMAHLNVQELQQRISVLFQDFTPFMLTAKENVGFGRIEHMEDSDLLVAAAHKGGALDIVERLPRGWDTKLGLQFQGGVELSSGQWQRIALSRAFFRDADIFVLDEPSASLDPLAEASVFEGFLELTRGKTSLLISHRLAACTRVDRIILLDHGVVAEEGTHDELMKRKGLYAAMFAAQAQHYSASPGGSSGELVSFPAKM
jgi:ATP-binding cassette, subfamily B, bacterial